MTTLIELLEKGDIPDFILQISEKEGLKQSLLIDNIIHGYTVIPKNNLHTNFEPIAIGKDTCIKINANIGSSPLYCNLENELQKIKVAIESGADAIMDLSITNSTPNNNKNQNHSEIYNLRKKIIQDFNITLGTVPIYETMQCVKNIKDLTIDKFLYIIEKQAKEKVDFMTIHAGLRKKHIPLIQKRVLGVVSRGGSILVKWMQYHEKENFIYEYFDKILEIAKAYDITLSLGDALRPGSTNDSNDDAQFEELAEIGKLVERCKKAKVQVMVEGPGHVPLNLIEENIKKEKEICNKAPFYVLGPLVIDNAAGYDHIAGAIGGALAGYYGADFLCYVTPAEHLRLPTIDDVKQGVIASKIAALAVDLANKRPNAIKRNLEMSKARRSFDWEKQEDLSIDKVKFKKYLDKITNTESYESKSKEIPCSMCGEWCAMKGN